MDQNTRFVYLPHLPHCTTLICPGPTHCNYILTSCTHILIPQLILHPYHSAHCLPFCLTASHSAPLPPILPHYLPFCPTTSHSAPLPPILPMYPHVFDPHLCMPGLISNTHSVVLIFIGCSSISQGVLSLLFPPPTPVKSFYNHGDYVFSHQ